MVSQRRRTQQVQALQASLAVGDEVVTTSGLYGTIVALDDTVVTLDTGAGQHAALRPAGHRHARHRGGLTMAAANPQTAARRSLLFLLAIVVVLGGLLAGAVYLSDAQDRAPSSASTSRAAPRSSSSRRPLAGQSVSTEQLNQARDIIVQRVDAGGVSGAEVTTQGDRNIVVSIPEIPTQEVRDAISKSSQLQFRPVLAVAAGSPQPDRHPVAERHRLTEPVAVDATPTTASSASPTSNSAVPEALMAPTPSPVRLGQPVAEPRRPPAPRPTDPTDLAWITAESSAQFDDLDCSDPAALDEHRRRPDQAARHLRRRRHGEVHPRPGRRLR